MAQCLPAKPLAGRRGVRGGMTLGMAVFHFGSCSGFFLGNDGGGGGGETSPPSVHCPRKGLKSQAREKEEMRPFCRL